MAKIDLTAIPRKEALRIAMDAFGMEPSEAEDFIALARGEDINHLSVTTTKATKPTPKIKSRLMLMMTKRKRHRTMKAARNPRTIKRDKLGRFARVAGSVARGANAFVLGYGSGLASSHAIHSIFRAKKLSTGVATAAGSLAASYALHSAAKRIVKKAPRRERKGLEKLISRGATAGRLTRHAVGVAKLLHRAGRGAARGARFRYGNRGINFYMHPRHSRSRSGPIVEGRSRDALAMVLYGKESKMLFENLKSKGVDNEQSYDAKRDEVRAAFIAAYPNPGDGASISSKYRYVAEVFPDYLICQEGETYYKVNYSETDSEFTFDGPSDWETVEREVQWQVKEVAAEAFVFKEQGSENYRWVLLSSNGYRDRDGELIETKALERDVALWELDGRPPSPLRLWHIATKEDFSEGLELGVTDLRMIYDHTLIESGTFIDPEVGAAVEAAQDKLAASVGFRHSLKEPDSDKIFHAVQIFERSLLPKERASNPLTHLLVTNEEANNA